jgi:hypothetical protein
MIPLQGHLGDSYAAQGCAEIATSFMIVTDLSGLRQGKSRPLGLDFSQTWSIIAGDRWTQEVDIGDPTRPGLQVSDDQGDGA